MAKKKTAAKNAASDDVEILKKITVAKCCGKAGEDYEKPAHNKTLELVHIFGEASRYAEKSTDKGPYLEFSGRFRAINAIDGRAFNAARLILPSIAEDIVGQLFMDRPQDDPNFSVKFAFTIGIKGDKTANTGYVFNCVSLIKSEAETDPLQEMQDQLTSTGKLALPAPQ